MLCAVGTLYLRVRIRVRHVQCKYTILDVDACRAHLLYTILWQPHIIIQIKKRKLNVSVIVDVYPPFTCLFSGPGPGV